MLLESKFHQPKEDSQSIPVISSNSRIITAEASTLSSRAFVVSLRLGIRFSKHCLSYSWELQLSIPAVDSQCRAEIASTAKRMEGSLGIFDATNDRKSMSGMQ